MGAWGFGLLESDNGYDVLSCIIDKTNLDFFTLIHSFNNIEDTLNREKIYNQLNNEELFYSLMKNESLDQFIIFGLYVNIGLSDFVEKQRQKYIFEGKKDPIKVLKKSEEDVINRFTNTFDKLKYKYNVDQVFENFENKTSFSFNSKGLFETIEEYI